MDVLVLTTMKNAAKCDTKSELQISVNLYVFERMLRFRVLLEACLFECLFSPLASLDQHFHFGGGGEREAADCGLSDSSSSRSTQVERRRVFTHVSERCNPFSKPMWCAASVVTKLVWKKTAALVREHSGSSVNSPQRPFSVTGGTTQLSDLKSGKRTR